MRVVRQLRPIVFFIVIYVVSCTRFQTVDEKKFESPDRAVKAIQAATSVGVNFVRFGELVINFATEINVLADKTTTPQEKELSLRYLKILEIYKDSYTIWHAYILQGSPAHQRVEVRDTLQPVVDRYGFATEKGTGIYDFWKTISFSEMQSLWNMASKEAQALKARR